MTATDELRRLLDERGVAHSDHYLSTTWRDGHGILHLAGEPMADGSLVVDMLTPAQAIAATLGGGECELHECEGSFSALNRPVWRCDCGAFMTQYTDATTYHKPRFCPNCGKAVKR